MERNVFHCLHSPNVANGRSLTLGPIFLEQNVLHPNITTKSQSASPTCQRVYKRSRNSKEAQRLYHFRLDSDVRAVGHATREMEDNHGDGCNDLGSRQTNYTVNRLEYTWHQVHQRSAPPQTKANSGMFDHVVYSISCCTLVYSRPRGKFLEADATSQTQRKLRTIDVRNPTIAKV